MKPFASALKQFRLEDEGLNQSDGQSSAHMKHPQPPSEPYDPIAEEYYNVALHPTCAAFEIASRLLLERFLCRFEVKAADICDVGAGKSVVLSILGNNTSTTNRVLLVDSSKQMLRWSEQFWDEKIERRILEADKIDQIGVSFDLVISSLGDPFNTLDFWNAVYRSLKDDGICVFTTPSYAWAQNFRMLSTDEVEDRALFILSDGSRHYVPSLIHSEQKQRELFSQSSLVLRGVDYASVDCLETIPPKLTCLARGTPIVVLYEVVKKP